MWKPEVSVVMCTYNGEAFLREQMESILAQTYPIKEFLIFDDGSSDKTAEIIETYRQQHSFIQFHKNTVNLGHNLNFEQGLKAAKSEVIAIADQDDVWHVEKIERMIARWNPEMPVIHCDSQRFEHVVPNVNRYRHLYHRFKGTNTKQLFVYNSVSGHAMLIRKSFLPSILPFEQDIYYDWWTAINASCNGGVDFIDEVLVYQRVHDQNVSINKRGSEKEKFRSYREEISRHIKKFLSIPNLKSEDKKFAFNLYSQMTSLETLKKRVRFFFTILKRRKTIFYIKQRKVGIFSHLKYALKWARL